MSDPAGQPALLRPPGGWAFLDWITGIVRVNCSVEFYRQVEAKRQDPGKIGTLTPEEILLLETITHESYHFFQVCTTGYLFGIADALFRVFQRYLTAHPVARYEDLPEAAPAGVAAEIASIKGLLDQPGPEDLTPRLLIEGAAFLAQKLNHWNGLTPEIYESMLAGEAEEYRLAYDVARELVGDRALTVVPLLTSLSLRSPEPVRAFVGMCRIFGAVPDSLLGKVDFMDLLESSTSRVMPHPSPPAGHSPLSVFSAAARRCGSLGEMIRVQAMARPDRMPPEVADLVQPAILFNPQGGSIILQIPRTLWPELDGHGPEIQGPKAERTKLQALAFELSCRLQR